MSDTRSPLPLPERPSLEQLRKQAKELRDAEHHDTLASAQLALARRYGFASWPKLKAAVELLELRASIDDGDLARATTLLDETPELVQSTFADGATPLHEAASQNRADFVELFVQRGAQVVPHYGASAHSALSWALTCEAFDAARKLVELGNEPDLFCAAGLGDLDRVRAFWNDGKLSASPSKTGSSRADESGRPLPRPPERDADQVSDALYIAARLGQLEVARWLLDHDADPNWRGYCGATTLAWAAFSGNTELFTLLGSRGASETMTDYVYGATPRVFPIIVFANWGFDGRLLRRLRADRSLLEARAGIGTPLHAAASGGQLVCTQILLAFGGDKSALDANGRTPAEVAESKGHAGVAALLR